MNYILIDRFNGEINLLLKEDGSGKPEEFNTLEAAEEALVNCHNGIIVPLINIIPFLRDLKSYIHEMEETGALSKILTDNLKLRVDFILG